MIWTGLVLEGRSDSMQKLRRQLLESSRRREPLLLVGEPGLGLRWISHAVYLESPSTPIPFYMVDCRLPLVEMRLLGSSPWLGYGLLNEPSYFALLLEEVGSLPDPFRKTLGEQLLKRPAESRPWLFATTTNSNSEQIEEICLHLFTGLPVKVMHIPPLRKRVQDIPPLIFKILSILSAPNDPPGVTIPAQQLLRQQLWPLNLIELVQFLERLLEGRTDNSPISVQEVQILLSPQYDDVKEVTTIDSLPFEELIRRRLESYLKQLGGELAEDADLYKQFLPLFERPLLELALRSTKGNQMQASQILGMNRNTLRKKCSSLRIDTTKFKPL